MNDGNGMFIGERLLCELGVLKRKPKISEVISGKCFARNKKIQGYLIHSFHLKLDDKTRNQIILFELFHLGEKFKDYKNGHLFSPEFLCNDL